MDMVMQRLVAQFRKDRELTHLRDDEAFEAFAAFCVLSSFYESEFSPDSFRMGGGNDLGVDVFGILVNGDLLRDSAEVRAVTEQARKLDVQIVVVQAKTSPGFEAKVISDLADNLKHIVGPGDLPYDSSPEVDNIRECLQSVYENISKLSGGLPRLHIRYVTTGEQVASHVERKARTAGKMLAGLERFDSVDFSCVTRRQLRELYKRATEAVPATFELLKKIALPKIPGVEQALLGLLPAGNLVRQVLTDPGGNIRKSLFNENVRDFLEYNDVNREISETLRDPERRQRFAVLNNGITIVTRELTVSGDDVHIRDFQIVNGCQTCHVLFDEQSQLTDAVQVSIRLVHSKNEDIIGGIVAATNRQTAVSEDELSAREEFHKELEDFFAAQPAPHNLYYERRTKQYSSRPEVKKTQIISRAQLTRAYAAMLLDSPAQIGHFKALVEERKDDLFKKGQQEIAYYTAAAAYYRLEWLFRNRRIPMTYSPARYHLLWSIKLRLIGAGPLPKNPRMTREKCNRILSVIWDPVASERLVLDLLLPLDRAMTAERAAGVPVGEMVRTQRFAERVKAAVLGGRGTPAAPHPAPRPSASRTASGLAAD